MKDAISFETLITGNHKKIGIATLNSSKSLNALQLSMIEQLTSQLTKWHDDQHVVCVVIKGSGNKAFCAGGDIRTLYDNMTSGSQKQSTHYAVDYFSKEYRLDYLIHRYVKPIIVWGSGIVMGGGVGLMAGASHRVVTETTVLAMPEINIGLYPDVGATWFLPRAPGRTGLFLGLTGARITGSDAVFAGLADRLVPSEALNEVLRALSQHTWHEPAHGVASAVLRSFETLDPLPDSHLRNHFDLIQTVTDGDTISEVTDNIVRHRQHNAWFGQAATSLEQGCPTTAHLVFEQYRRGKRLPLEAAFKLELILSVQCTLHPDLSEGIRAVIIDKDSSPSWQHATVDDVPSQWVEEHYSPPWGDRSHPLLDLDHTASLQYSQ